MGRSSTRPDGGAIPQLVVIGSSAGGIDALAVLLGTIRRDFPAPILLAQHLDPRRPSHLSEIVRRNSTLPVVTVEDRTDLRPGTIYVVPSNRNVAITDHEVRIQSNGRSRSMPSIDLLLESAAASYGEGLIAVILTGAGSDGAAGARHVKVGGGTVVIQDPKTASFPAMPLSLAPTTIDVVADLEAIGPLLGELLSGAYQPRRGDEETLLASFLDEVRASTGIDFSQYKRPTILRRLQRRMVATGSAGLREYVRHVQREPAELHRLTTSFLIKVTEFFRDPELYRYLRDRVIPELISHAEGHRGELRFWSAGCATGEEAYSLAIIAAEALGERTDIKLRIFATDIDAEAIEFARRGIYPAAALNRLTNAQRERFFVETGGQYEAGPLIRSLIAFGQHDLAARAPFPRIDLAVCRNVLIYFTHDLQRRALQLFAFSLRDGGYLALGKAETSSPLGDHFVLEEPRLKVYRRHGSRVVLPATRVAGPSGLPAAPSPPRVRSGSAFSVTREGDLERARIHAARADELILRLPIGLVMVDRHYDITSINSSARAMLGVHGSAIGQDLVHLAQGISSAELRRGIDAAFRGEPWRATWDIPVAETVAPEIRSLDVIAYRQSDGASGSGEIVVLLIRDVTAEHAERRDIERALAEQRSTSEQLTMQLERAAEQARLLRDANSELTVVNAELRSQNDELLVSTEEAQAATEEVETLNEEMQATNEELETLNEEMQATVEELNTTNDDLEARSSQLQDLAVSLERQREVSEAERARLAAVLVAMADGVLVVDGEGATVLTNEAYPSLLEATEEELEGEDGDAIPPDSSPRARAARGETFSVRFAKATKDGERRWFEASGRPLPQGGGVVVIRDITDRSLQRMQNEFLMTLSHELRTPLTGLLAYLEMLLRRTRRRDDEAETRYIERAVNQARRFSGMIDELFDVNRIRSGRMQYDFAPVELKEVVEEAVALAAGIDEHRRIDVDPGSADLVVRGDAHRIQQVVFNLVANALRHAPESERILVKLRKRGGSAELAVQDWGPGIERERIGDLFRRPEAGAAAGGGGLGLGLYIAHSIVDAHGGTIDVASEQGSGTTMRVRLPLSSS